MIPELGKYATEVLSAYAVSLTLLSALIGWTLYRGRAARAALDAVEQESEKDG